MAAIKQEVIIEVDGATETRQRLERIETAENALRSAFQRGEVGLGDYEKQLKRLQKESKELEGDLKSLSKQGNVNISAKGDLGLAGQAQTSLGAIGGVTDLAGLGGGGALGAAGEIVSLVEELPKLKGAVSGLPSTLSAAASALGPAGLVVAGVAAGAAAIAFAYKQSIKEQEQALKDFANAAKEFVAFAAGGGTVEDAQQRIADNERLIKYASDEIERLNEEYARQNFNALDKVFNDGEQALIDARKDLEEQIRTAQAENERLNEAVAEGELPYEETTAAVRDASAATSEFADSERNLTDVRQQGLKIAEAQRQAEDKVAKEREDAIKKQQQAQEQAAKAAESYQSSLRKISNAYGDTLKDIERGVGDKRVDIARASNDKLIDIEREYSMQEQQEQREFLRNLSEIRKNADKAEEQALRSRNFAAYRDAQDEEQEALDERTKQEEETNRQQLMAYQEQRRKVTLEAQRQTRELAIEAERQRRDAAIARDRQNRDAQMAYQQAIKLQQQFAQTFINGFSKMFQEAGKIAGNTPVTQKDMADAFSAFSGGGLSFG